ncbi:vitamin B12 transporter btuB [Zobellella denitrificans]|uniref:Vitamin B12 transporter btuB n=1 Tax=Zobellella denitrificans TaxID=347534 RepID=A0A231N1S4_9GAMM|nr:TonB-dependent receptor [Zobellella denitrificans]ATG75752.1 vitamin B12 transporter btuB [Zobellella denitrificans]OXS16279.1 vitamin B12 transporter btuB [Zobellella denitrificans]
MSKQWLAAALLPWAAFAQNSSDSTDITIYNRVTQPLTSALAPVEVITKSEIERRQPRSLVDLLETLPGMQFGSQNGGIGQQSSLFVRGTNSDHVLVLMNGRPMAQMVSSNVDFSQLPVSNVERIEYIRGPRAAIYGSKAIGGVVNIITTSEVNTTQVGVTTGSNDYYAADLSINQWVTDATRLQLASGYRETRGYDVQPGNNQPDRDGFESKNLTLGIEHQLNQQWTLDANFNGWKNNLEYDGWTDINETKAYQIDTGIRYQGKELVGQLNASYGEYEAEDWNKGAGRQTASNTSTATTRLDGLTQYHYSEQGYVLMGMDWQRDRLLARTTGTTAPDRDNTGVYASVFHTWAPVSIELTGRMDDNEQFGTYGTWQSALSVALPEQHKATLSYGTAFRAPNLLELYAFWGNPNFDPEESENWELSFTGDYQRFNWQLNLYRNEIDNLLFSQSPTRKDSTDTLIKGAEFVVKATTGPVHHTASYEYTDAEDQRAPNQGKQLVNRAKRKLSWTGDIDIANTNLFAQVLYVGDRETFDANTFARTFTPSYTIWNIGARYPLTSNLTLNGKVNNLFDKDYQVVSGYDAPGMEFYIGADYRF